MKKIISILIISVLVLSGLQAAASPLLFTDTSIEKWTQISDVSLVGDDVLDQSQPDMEFFGPVGNIFYLPDINYITVQSFIPTKNILTRVEIEVGKNQTTTYDFKLAIKDDLFCPDLTSLSLPPDDFLTDLFGWVEFNFDDIAVQPGETYYIVCSTFDQPNNWYAWGAMLDDVYPNGSVLWSEDNGVTFEEDPNADFTFKTYGYNNEPPDIPVINGETKGKVGQSYSYTFVSTDHDNDGVSYYIDWGDGINSGWIGPYSSGDTIIQSHTWTKKGDYTIKVKARDFYGNESDWGELSVTMPFSFSIPFQSLWSRLFERFPHAFPILRHIMGY